MPVAVPNSNSFYKRINKRYGGEYENKRTNSYYKYCIDNDYNYHQPSGNVDITDNNNVTEYINKLKQKNRRLETINDIFLNMLREQKRENYLLRNRSCEDITNGSFPYLSFNANGNKKLVYLNKDSINNNKIISGPYRNDYLVPLFPKNNSIADNNRMSYLLNNEKLKLFRNPRPYFNYNVYNDMNNEKNYLFHNIPQKVNSVQYANKIATYKKYSFNNQNINNNKDNESNILSINKKTNKENDNDIINEIKKNK